MLEKNLKSGALHGVSLDRDEKTGEMKQTVTYKIGEIRISGKRSELDKQKLLEQMIEDDLVIRVPINLMRYLGFTCLGIGLFAFRRDWVVYYGRLSEQREGVDYVEWYRKHKIVASIVL